MSISLFLSLFFPAFSLLFTPLLTPSCCLFMEMRYMHARRWAARCCLCHSRSVRPSISRTPERRKDKADDPSPSTLLCFFCCFCFHPLRCFFSSLHQNHFQLARDSDRLCSVSGQEDFQATFQAMMNAHHCPVHCSHVRLFTVSQIPMNYLFSRNNHWNKKTKQS